MPPNELAVLLAAACVGAGLVLGFSLGRSKLVDRRADLKAILLERSDCLRAIDECAQKMHRVRCEGGTRDELTRLDRDLRRKVARFLELDECAVRKGGASVAAALPDVDPAEVPAVLARRALRCADATPPSVHP